MVVLQRPANIGKMLGLTKIILQTDTHHSTRCRSVFVLPHKLKQTTMNAFNVYMHRGHSIKYFSVVYVFIFTAIMLAVIVAERFFIQ